MLRENTAYTNTLLPLPLIQGKSILRLSGLYIWYYLGEPVLEPIWILLKQETVSGSSISWSICKSAPLSRPPRQHPTTQFYTGRMPFLPPNQQRQSTEGSSHTTAAKAKSQTFPDS